MSRDHLRQTNYRYKGVSRQYSTMIAWIFVSLQIGLYWIESSLRRLTLRKFGCLQKPWEKLQLSEPPSARRSKVGRQCELCGKGGSSPQTARL